MGWTKYLLEHEDTCSLTKTLQECLIISDGRVKVEEGKLFKRCKNINTEKYYRTVEPIKID